MMMGGPWGMGSYGNPGWGYGMGYGGGMAIPPPSARTRATDDLSSSALICTESMRAVRVATCA
ncbi:MAG: hypothetical protein H0X47_17645 [Nitrospirales bacterium]|nr:hypothetical protein [Nitrospirales bacterium]